MADLQKRVGELEKGQPQELKPRATLKLDVEVREKVLFKVNPDPAKRRIEDLPWREYRPGVTRIEVPPGEIEYMAWRDKKPTRVNLKSGEVKDVHISYVDRVVRP